MKKDYGSFTRHWPALPLEVFMFGAAVVTLSRGNWKYLAISLFTFAISFIPLLVERWLRIKISPLLQVLYVAFIFASMFSGEVLGVYGHIWPWDDGMHFVSGLLIGLGTIVWLIAFTRRQKQTVLFGVLAIFCLNAAIAVVWEIVEFASDQLFGTFSQGADLADTMMDLVYGLTGGLIMGAAWVLYVNGKKVFIISRLLDQFDRLNVSKVLRK
jgi:hypothetical protein